MTSHLGRLRQRGSISTRGHTSDSLHSMNILSLLVLLDDMCGPNSQSLQERLESVDVGGVSALVVGNNRTQWALLVTGNILHLHINQQPSRCRTSANEETPQDFQTSTEIVLF